MPWSSMTLLLAGAIGIGGLDACGHSTPRGAPTVVLQVHGAELPVQVELARSEPERERGLMFRQKLESGRGMLFLFERTQDLKFWMKNTYIPLDMIFLDDNRRVVFVEENAEPLTLNPRGPKAYTRYVLEVPGGWARAHGVEPGVAARFVNVD